jgi:hypothetical protein
MDTKTMNEALLGKWGWRMLKADPDDQVYMLLKNKYMLINSFLQCQDTSCSQFWKGVLKSRDNLKWGCKSEVNNDGMSTRFWEDIWAGDIPLGIEFPTLYKICDSRRGLVGDCWEGDGWKISFKRHLGDSDFREWERLMDTLDDFRIGEKDRFVWILHKSKNYSTRKWERLMYRRLTFRGITNKRMIKLWKSKLPNKLKVFVWLAAQDRLQTGVNLK